MPDSNRQVLDTLFRSGRVPVQKSSFLDTPPNPLSQNADFSRIEGMMLDLAIGDALGITTEAWLPERRGSEYGEIRDYIPNRYVAEPIGFPSDDSQLAFWTLEQLLEDGGFNAENLADRFCQGHIFGIGGTVRLSGHLTKQVANFRTGCRSALRP